MERIPPKEMADIMVKLLKQQRPDANYLKKTFQHIRDALNIHGNLTKEKKLPELLTDDELKRFYEAVWTSNHRTHMIMVKLLIYTGIRNAELVNIKIEDVDLSGLKILIKQGKGKKDRYVPIAPSFRGELTQYILVQKEYKAVHLFESNRYDKFSTRWVRQIVKKYALKAGIEKRIYPHLFRHQLLTYLTKNKIVDAKIQIISGHTDRQGLSVYQDLSLKDIQDEYQNVMKNFPVQ
jgi:integrase/recombinase XerD